MTAPRARERSDPPAPPDRRPPRRGGGSSPSPYTCASAAGRAAGPARPPAARRGLVRSARALAAAALLALAGTLALPATAQAQTTFVSNLAETQGSSAQSIQATSFSTGSHTAGYMLSTVQLHYHSAGNAADTSAIRVKIRTLSSGVPGDLVADLSSPASFTANTIVSFTAPPNTMLDAGEIYWVVINEGYESSSERLRFYQTASADETTTTGDSNWSIGNDRLWANASSDGWTTSSNSLKIAIIGTAVGSGTPPDRGHPGHRLARSSRTRQIVRRMTSRT